MSIKSDRWIRRMAQEHGMLEPFEPGQVKQVDGQWVATKAVMSRSARVLMEGAVRVPREQVAAD